MYVVNKLKYLQQDTCEICVLMPRISSFSFMRVFLECPWDFTTFFSLLFISSTGGRALAALLKWKNRSVCSMVVWRAKQEHVLNAPMLMCRNVPSSPTTTVKIVVRKLAKQNLSKGLCVGAHELLY